MAQSWKHGSHLRIVSHLNNCVTLKEMGHSWVAFGKMVIWKNGSHLQKWVALRKMDHICKNGSSNLEKWVTRAKMCHTYSNGSHLENTLKLVMMCDTYKNGSLFKKMGHT